MWKLSSGIHDVTIKQTGFFLKRENPNEFCISKTPPLEDYVYCSSFENAIRTTFVSQKRKLDALYCSNI